VGTEEARFRTTPRYQAHAVGPRAAELPFGFQTLIAFPSLAEATPDGFTFRLLLPNLGGPEVNPWLPGEPELGPQVLAGVETYVVWMGVEG
jgi:hypothetical protein